MKSVRLASRYFFNGQSVRRLFGKSNNFTPRRYGEQKRTSRSLFDVRCCELTASFHEQQSSKAKDDLNVIVVAPKWLSVTNGYEKGVRGQLDYKNHLE